MSLVITATMAVGLCGCTDNADTDGVDGAEGSATEEGGTEESGKESGEESKADLAALAAEVEEPGPWAVGTTTVETTGARDRQLPVQVWYPVDTAVAATAEPATYDFPGIEVPAGAVTGASPAPGPFPLVIYSHGNGGLRYVSSFLAEHMASHGFVVMAPDHVGNTALDTFLGSRDETDQVAEDRPVDVQAVIDAATSGQPGLEEVSPVVDGEEVAVIGHSFGGYTALALASRQAEGDDSLDAIVGLAPASSGVDDTTLEAVGVPTLLISGTLDETTPIEEDTLRPAELVSGRPLVRADIDGAGHQSFTDVCDYLGIAESQPDLPAALVEAVQEYALEGCAPELIVIDEAQRITNRLVTAFLLETLYADDSWSPLLSPGAEEGQPLALLERED